MTWTREEWAALSDEQRGLCDEWQGRRDAHGYGKKGNLSSHRVAWAEAHGPIPDGLCVLHHCDNPPCCNVEHLFLGTQADNVYDMVAKGRNYVHPAHTHCIRGHELTPENSRWTRGGRTCRTCYNAAWRAWYHRTKKAV